MLKIKTRIGFIVFVLLILSSMTLICYANSAEPPSILILISNAPDDLEISMGSDNNFYEGRKIDKIIETYYTFYSSKIQAQNLTDYTLNVTTGDESFKINLDKPIRKYQNVYTLDLNNRNLIEGKLLSRSILLVTMRVVLTLTIEAVVFLLFKFKNKKSWISFVIINIITQGALNLWINGLMPTQSYILLGLIFAELLIFAAEIATFIIIVKEHSKLRTFFYVLTANLLSLIAGGYIITILPI